VAVLPQVATMAQGSRPAARSLRMAAASASARMSKLASTGIMRTLSRPKPASSAAFSTELCACEDT
jgi:hypothetical protein